MWNWNVGTYWSKNTVRYYIPFMIEYGFRQRQIAENPESSYSELIIWNSCKMANSKKVPIHIVDRDGEIIDKGTDPYYYTLRDEFGFSEIYYDNYMAKSMSNGGRVLTTNGNVNYENLVDIIFVSILIK